MITGLANTSRALFAKYRLSFLLYLAVGGICALIEWGVFYQLNIVMGMGLGVAAVAGFILATFVNFLLCSFFLFNHRRTTTWFREMLLVYGASMFAFIPNLGITWLILDVSDSPAMVAKIAGTGFGFVINYLLRQFSIFSKEPRWQR